MRKARLCALFLMVLLLFTACTANKTAHSYPEGAHTHVYGNRYDVVPATCRETGTVVRYCKICHGEVTEAVAVPEDIAARAHAFSDTVVAPTEATEGYTVRRCLLCDYVVERTLVVPAKYALLADEQTVITAPAGATGVMVSDTVTHVLSYHVGGDTAVSADIACVLATVLTLVDEMTCTGASVTPETNVAFGALNYPAKSLLFAYIEDEDTDALRALALAIAGDETAFAAKISARLARLGVSDGAAVNPFAPAENTATLGATAVLLARVLDEPLLVEGFGEAVGILQSVAGKKPALYLTSADGTLRAVAISEEGGVRFSVVCGEALPSDYEDALYPTK